MKLLDAIVGTNSGGGGFLPYAPVPGSSFRVRDFSPAFKAKIVSLFIIPESAGKFQILSPYFHDMIKGLIFDDDPTGTAQMFPQGFTQLVKSGDTPVFRSISNFNPSSFVLSIFYDNLPNVPEANFIDYLELERRGVNLKTVDFSSSQYSLTGFSSPNPLNDNTFKQDKQYAFLGAQSDYSKNILRILSKDLGNSNVMFPCGNAAAGTDDSWNYFQRLSCNQKVACIPVLNGINMSTVIIDGIGTTNYVGVLFFVELK